jgi:integrase
MIYQRLTARRAETLKRPGRYSDGGGLRVQVKKGRNGITRSWLYCFKQDGKEHRLGLGPLRLVSLAEARDVALELSKLRLQGIHPKEYRLQQKASQRLEAARAMSFQECALAYHAAHRASWASEKHATQWLGSMEAHVFGLIGTVPVGDVTMDHVLAVLQQREDGLPLWERATVTASRLRGRIESVLDFAIGRRFRSAPNPAMWKGNLAAVLPAPNKLHRKQHYPALPVAEVPAFMRDLRSVSRHAARALELLCLTASRSNAIRGMRWDEIDGDVWVTPAARMKGKRVHRVPLTPRCRAILDSLPRTHALVFPGRQGRGMGETALLDAMASLRPGFVPHGLRSSFRDWCLETGQPPELAELALAHLTPSETERAYRRGDALEQRRALMGRWDRYCMEGTAKVLALKAAKQRAR